VSVKFSHALLPLWSTHDHLAIRGLGLASHGLDQSDLVWRSPLWCFRCKLKTVSHI